MKEFIIGKNEAGQRLDRFIHKLLPKAGKGFLQKMLRKKNITLNGSKASPSDFINMNDVVKIFFSDETFDSFTTDRIAEPTSSNLKVIFEDDNILVVHKPANLLTHGTKDEKKKTLINHILNYLIAKGDYTPSPASTFRPACSIRLDRNTSGLVIACKNYNSLKAINQAIRERQIDKYYKAVVYTESTPAEGCIDGFILKDEKDNISKIFKTKVPGSKEIQMELKILNKKEKFYIIGIKLITGRSHQIRSYLQSQGIFILGDKKYGNSIADRKAGLSNNIGGQMLLAYKLDFGLVDDNYRYLNELNIQTDFAEKHRKIIENLFGLAK